MVLRSSDVPRTPGDRLADHSTQLDEVARAISRGSQALRNDAGHILNLNPESPNPLLVPTGGNNNIDSALKFQDGGLEVRSPDGEAFRDFGARGGYFRGTVQASYVHSDGEIRADGGIRTEAGLSSGGDALFSGVMSAPFRARGANWSSSLYDGAIRWNPNGAVEVVTYDGSAFRGVYASNFAPPPSWRDYKIVQRQLADVLGCEPGDIIDRLDLATSWTYDPDKVSFADGVERIGPRLDEIPDALIVRSVDDETGEDRSSWDIAGMLTVALAELQALRKRVAELEEQAA